MTFVKIHGSILDSSVWSLSPAACKVWVTMLAMADEDGIVNASLDGLARRAVLGIEETEEAIDTFLGPDPHSRDGTTGERIEVVPGGWFVINHAEYRDRQTRAQKLAAARAKRCRERKRDASRCNAASREENGRHDLSPSEAEAEAEAEKNPPKAPQPKPARKPRSSSSRKLWDGEIPESLARDLVFPTRWHDWLGYRRDELRKPVTPRSGDMALKKLAEMGSKRAIAAIEHTIANGWQGIREPEAPRPGTVSGGSTGKTEEDYLNEVGKERRR